MFLSHIPLPSISLVLEAKEDGCIPGSSSVIIVHDQPTTTWALPSPSPDSHLMKTLDFRNVDEDEHFSFVVYFPDGSATDTDYNGLDARTIFKENRPKTSRGLASQEKSFQLPNATVKRKFSGLRSTVRRLFPIKLAGSVLRKPIHH